jgi:hypothetical protein
MINITADITASFRRAIAAIAAVLLSNALCLSVASAQFGTGFPGASLPDQDFTWTWGDQRHAGRGIEDISALGNEAGFRCNLSGKLRIGSGMSKMDVRGLESKLRGNVHFVQAAANAMNDLESRGELEWATLECVKPKRKQE